MIILDVKPYCENCRSINPGATINTAYGDNSIAYVETRIVCQNAEFCENIAKYIDFLKKNTKGTEINAEN